MKVAVANEAWQQKALVQQQKASPAFAIKALQKWQQAALDDFLQMSFPDRFHEDWKYTQVVDIARTRFSMQEKTRTTEALALTFVPDAYRVVFVDGEFKPQLCQLPAEVNIINTLSVLDQKKWRDLLVLEKQQETPFSRLNAALLTDGVFIEIPENHILQQPIHVVYYHSSPQEPLMHHPRHIIYAKANSQFSVIEEYRGCGSYFNNVVTHIVTEPGATIAHYKIQDESREAQHIANTLVTQAKDSTVFSYVVSLGAKLGRDNLTIDFKQPGASCYLYGFYFPQGVQLIDHHTWVEHLVPQCMSQQDYRGIAAEKGHAVFNGKVRVHKDAQKTIAYQANKNLLLDTDAEIDTKPELEIYADDVKCSHGATIGQLDENALFYLRSRGIEVALAQRILMQGFAEEILTHVTEVNIARYLQQKIMQQLEKLA